MTMLEEIAKAVWNADENGAPMRARIGAWENAPEHLRAHQVMLIRAAVKKMRDLGDLLPALTANVCIAGTESGCYEDHNPPPLEVWQDGIDAILNEAG